jgi:hypothetical protein
MKNNRTTQKRNRDYVKSTEKRCLARGSHNDAIALVEYLLARGGKDDKPAEQIAQDLRWEQRLGGMRQTDMGRFHRARNHVKDGRSKDGRPCTGYSLHYRSSALGSHWMLVDPSGDLGHHTLVAAEELRGDIQQQVAFRTINGRRIATAEQMAEMCLKQAPPDGVGHRLLLTYTMELKRFGAISDELIAEIMVWLSGKVAA